MVLPLIGFALALTIFLCGLFLLKDALRTLEPVMGPALRHALGRPLWGVLIGCVVTAVIQSSSATNAMAVGLVAAGVLELKHAFAIVLGSNIGTTVTGQIAAFGTFDLAIPTLLVGGLLHHMGSPSLKAPGSALVGLGGLFFGLWAMGRALGPIGRGSLGTPTLMVANQSDIAAVFLGAGLTAVVQSSSVVTSLLVGLADAGVVTVRAAISGALGSNVGTVVTTILAGFSGGTLARRTALADLLFNLAGVVLVWPLLPFAAAWMETTAVAPGRQVANAHTLFNLITVIAVLPVFSSFCRLVAWLMPERKPPKE